MEVRIHLIFESLIPIRHGGIDFESFLHRDSDFAIVGVLLRADGEIIAVCFFMNGADRRIEGRCERSWRLEK